jgi:simple sugar transport system ATP-binding protein
MSAALAFVGVSRRFGARVALDRVDLELHSGEIHALLGENGAGKTTLARMALGLVAPDAGRIEIDGRPVTLDDPAVAAARGIAMVHQHSALAAALSVAENLLLADAPRCWSLRNFHARARERLARHGLHLDPAAPVASLSVGERQRLEIARAQENAERVLLLDEPTAVLTPRESDALHEQLRTLRRRGLALALITHKVDDALRLGDRITVLRGGRVVLHARRGEVAAREVTRALFGSPGPMPAAAPPGHAATERAAASATPPANATPRLEARGLAGATFGPLDLVVRSGERVVVTGVDGNGQTELLQVLHGLAVPRAGTIPVRAAARACIPGERQKDGLALPLSAAENVSLGRGAPPRRWFTRRELEAHARPRLERFDVRATSPWQPAAELSGGNQQKLVLARELAGVTELVLAENPTRGLDLAASAFVRAELCAQAAAGAGVLVATTDLDEALELATRLFVIVRGRLHAVPATREAVAARLAELAAPAAVGLAP